MVILVNPSIPKGLLGPLPAGNPYFESAGNTMIGSLSRMRWPRATTIRSLTMILIIAATFSGSISPVSQLLGYILPVREAGSVNAGDPPFLLLPPSRTNVTLVQGGGSLSSSITANANVTVYVTFSILSTLPTGVTASITNNPCNTPCTVTITFSASSTATTGTMTVIVQAVGGGDTHTKNLLLTVYPSGAFSFALQPPTRGNVTLVQGGGSLSSSIAAVSFTNMSLTFSVASVLPTGVTAIFTNNPCNTNCTATVSLSASSTATTGTTTVTIQAVGGGVTHTTSLSLKVYPVSAFTFSLSGSPSSLTVVRGSVSSSSFITAVSFTNMSLTFSVSSGLPTGVTAIFANNPCNTNCTATVSFAANATATVGTRTVVVQGAGGSATRTTGFSLTVYPLSVLGFDCAYGSNTEGAVFPSSVTTSAPYSAPDFDGTLDSTCQATYLGDTDGAIHPLVSDNPTAVVTAGSGGGLTIDVVAVLNPATTIDGFDISLNFDTKVLRAVAIDQSGLIWSGVTCGPSNPPPNCLPTGAFEFNLARTINNTAGLIRLAQAVVGVSQSTSSELFRVRFDIVGTSTGSPITIFNDVLTSPGSIPHVTQNLKGPGIDTTSLFNVLTTGTSSIVASWTFSPNPEVPGSSLTFTASASCPACPGPLSYTWDFSSQDSPGYTYKSQATSSSVTLTAPSPVINRVTLTINDTATPRDSIRATMLLPLVLKMGPPVTTLTQGTAGGSWSAQWLGGVTTSTSGYTGNWIFCPGSGTVKTVCSAPIVAISQSGAGTTQTSSPSALTYNFAGLYNATLKIADTPESQIGTAPAGNTALSNFLVNVTGSTPAYAVVVTADNNSPGASIIVTLRAAATYDSTYPSSFRASKFNYVFDFGDGTPTITVSQNQTATVQHTFPSSGSFIVKVVAQEFSQRAPSQIEENGFLRIRPLCPSTSSCDFPLPSSSPSVGQSVTFTASAAGGVSPYTFAWDFGDGSATVTGSSVNHTYHSSGTFNVTLTITDASGQTQTVKKTVTIGGGSGGGGGGSDLASFLTSPLGLGLIAAAAIIILGAILFLRRRGRRPAPAQVSP